MRRVRWGNVGRLAALLAAGLLIASGDGGAARRRDRGRRMCRRRPSSRRWSGAGPRSAPSGAPPASRAEASRASAGPATGREEGRGAAWRAGAATGRAEPACHPRRAQPCATGPARPTAPPPPPPAPQRRARRVQPRSGRGPARRPRARRRAYERTGASPRRLASMSASWSSTQSPGSRAVTIRFRPWARHERSSADIVSAR